METIAGLVLLCLGWAAWYLVPQAITRIGAQSRSSWAEGPRGQIRVISYASLAIVGCAAHLYAFSFSWGSFVALFILLAVLGMAYELICSGRDSAAFEEQQREAARLRREQLATGQGWGRHDVLEKHRTTLFYKSGVRTKTTEGWRCAICRKNLYKAADATVDHIKPRSKYPHLRNTEENLQILCQSCNSTKHAYDGEDWKLVVRKRRRARRKPGPST
jgi:5-methylcytosine-specific restriction endonuclease McrA